MMQGRTLFSGYLCHDTAEQIADAFRQVLDGKEFTFVAVNEGHGYRPEVRPNCRVKEPISVGRYGDGGRYVVVRFNQHDYTSVITTAAQSQFDASKSKQPGPDWRYVHVTDRGIEIEHYAPAGFRLYWTLVTTGPIPED